MNGPVEIYLIRIPPRVTEINTPSVVQSCRKHGRTNNLRRKFPCSYSGHGCSKCHPRRCTCQLTHSRHAKTTLALMNYAWIMCSCHTRRTLWWCFKRWRSWYEAWMFVVVVVLGMAGQIRTSLLTVCFQLPWTSLTRTGLVRSTHYLGFWYHPRDYYY